MKTKNNEGLAESFNVSNIIKIGEEKGFRYNSFEYSIKGNTYTDALFNHKDIPHFNHLHPNLAYGYGNEGALLWRCCLFYKIL